MHAHLQGRAGAALVLSLNPIVWLVVAHQLPVFPTPDTSVRGYEDANSARRIALVLMPWWKRSIAYDSLGAWFACWGSP